jgi:hypothetical protein
MTSLDRRDPVADTLKASRASLNLFLFELDYPIVSGTFRRSLIFQLGSSQTGNVRFSVCENFF